MGGGLVFRVLAPVGVQSSSDWLSSGCTVWEKVLGENLEASALGPLDCGSSGCQFPSGLWQEAAADAPQGGECGWRHRWFLLPP